MKLNAKFLTAVKKMPVAAIALIGLSSSMSAYAWRPIAGDFNWNGHVKVAPSYNGDGGGSSLQVMTEDYWKFRLENRTNYSLAYRVNGEDFLLAPGRYKDHQYRKEYGTNSNNVRSYSRPRIEFDSDVNLPGWQTVAYNMGENKIEYFQELSYGRVNLYH